MLAEILITTLALLAGLACGWWWFGTKQAGPREALEKELHTFTRSVERVMMAVGQVQDVTRRVAHDVGNHSSEVDRISSELELLRESEPDSIADPAVSIISEMLSVNVTLQQQLAAAEEKLQAQTQEIVDHYAGAERDSLTGLPARSAFDRELARHFAEWTAKQIPFSIMVVDIDGFKKFHSTHGREAADEMLRHLGRKLREFTREHDLVCRFGAEEFVAIMPRTEIEAAAHAALRTLNVIDAMRVPWKGKRLHTTIRFGLAQTLPGEDEADLLRRAADALYAANRAGGNCGYLHDGSECRPVTEESSPPAKGVLTREQNRPIELLPSLPDRPQLDQELQRRISDCQQYGLPLSLLLLSVPECGQVQAEQGQDAADWLLDAVAVCLLETIRGMDYLARDGAGRFAIVLPGSTAAEAKQVALRVRAITAGRKIQLARQTVCISPALGLASYKSGDGVSDLRLRAELQLAQVHEHEKQPLAVPAELEIKG
jgi:diguanylate cyclase (GGDEF)-like protein